MIILGIPVSLLDLVLLLGIAAAFVAGSLAVASIERDRRAGRVKFRQTLKAAKVERAANARTRV